MKKIAQVLMFLLFTSFAFSQSSFFYGMTSNGGSCDAGTIFSTNADGTNYQVEYEFTTLEKKPLGGFIQASDGMLYAMTSEGGPYGKGAIIKLNPTTDNYIRVHNFDGDNGAKPNGNLLQASNGKLYGVTSEGGPNGWDWGYGVLFEFDPATGVYSKKFDFDGEHGGIPTGTLIQASNGKLYGVTEYGGTGGAYGVLFEYDIETGDLSVVHNFITSTDGYWPVGGVTQASNGKLYGVTNRGGANDAGTLFEYDLTTSTYTIKYEFPSAYRIKNTLIQTSDNVLYGMSEYGGDNGNGLIYEFDIKYSTFTEKYSFDYWADGCRPEGKLFLDSGGKLYGTTTTGASNSGGSMFEYDLSDPTNIKVLYEFESSDSDDENGSEPIGDVFRASNGKLYAMTPTGGNYKGGILFKYDIKYSTFIKLHSFGKANNGSHPYGSLLQASNGKLYAMTQEGGDLGKGVLFELDPSTGELEKKYDFGGSNGANPKGNLIQASNGKLYGMTVYGGSHDVGIVFQYNTSDGNLSKIYDFDNSVGARPKGSLTQALDGNLYGLTSSGGDDGGGALFQLDLNTETMTLKHSFDWTGYDGPTGSLTQSDNGKLYGMQANGGANNYGAIFEYNPKTDAFSVKYDFDDTNGSHPYGSLIQTGDGNLYGLTSRGGTEGWGYGVIFQFNPSNYTYKKIHDFTANAIMPHGDLLQADNGNLYGMTLTNGLGNDDFGDLFEFDISDNTFEEKHYFDENGKNPYGNLIQICKDNMVTQSISACGSYTWIDGQTYTESNNTAIYTLINSCGMDSIVSLDLTINPIYNILVNREICEGDTFYFGTQKLTQTNLYENTFQSINTCDSTVRLNLRVNPLPEIQLPKDYSQCGSFTSLEASATGGTPSYIYNWQQGIIGQHIIVAPTETTTYQLVVTDSKNCTDTAETTVKVIEPLDIGVCMVTVDTSVNKNLIVWESPNTDIIQSFNVYKEVSSNYYQRIGVKMYGEITEFIDFDSEPSVHADKYKISVVDTCGNEWDKSYYHQTINLSQVKGAQEDQIVLIWNKYIDESGDFIPSVYNIYRGLDVNNLVFEDAISGGLSTYNYNINDVQSGEHFLVAIDMPGCDPSENRSSGGPYYQSSSNIEDEGSIDTQVGTVNTDIINIYPNPTEGIVNITGANNSTIEIIDITGEIVETIKSTTNNTIIDLSNKPNGVYIVKISTLNNVTIHKLVIE